MTPVTFSIVNRIPVEVVVVEMVVVVGLEVVVVVVVVVGINEDVQTVVPSPTAAMAILLAMIVA